jgi:DNA invertase Pin-like site-specific DNA recombinase
MPAKVIAYARVSTDKQDVAAQKLVLLEYARKQQILIRHFISVEMSAGKPAAERKVEELLSLLNKGDTLLVTELSRLGRNMLETLNLVQQIHDLGVALIFVKQPELSLQGPQTPLLMAIYSHFAQVERTFISMRTKQGLELAKSRGKKLGRPKGSRNKKGRIPSDYTSEIHKLLSLGVPVRSIARIINEKSGLKMSYSTYRNFVADDKKLSRIYLQNRNEKQNENEKQKRPEEGF